MRITKGLSSNSNSGTTVAGITDINGMRGPSVTIDKSTVGLSNVINKQQVTTDQMGVANGVATLDVNGSPVQVPTKTQIGLGNVINKLQLTADDVGVTLAKLDSNGFLADSEIPTWIKAIASGLVWKGVYDAAANLPVIPAASSTNKGWLYKVKISGKNSYVTGSAYTFNAGDWIIGSGTDWEVVPSFESVSSVNSQVGSVYLTASDVKAIAINVFNAKGDLVVGTGTGTYTNLPVGVDGKSLVADSTKSGGIGWGDKLNTTSSPNQENWAAGVSVRQYESRVCTSSVGILSAGQLIRSLSARTTSSTFNAAEAAYWEPIGGSSGGSSNTVKTLNADGSPDSWVQTVKVDCSNGLKTVTLLTAVGASGKSVDIKKTDNSVNPVCIKPYGSELIEGNSSPVYLFQPGDSVVIRSDGYNSQIIADNRSTAYAQASILSMKNSVDQALSPGTVMTFNTVICSVGSDITYSNGIFTFVTSGVYHITATARQCALTSAMDMAVRDASGAVIDGKIPMFSSNSNTSQGDSILDFDYQFNAGQTLKIVCAGGSGTAAANETSISIRKTAQSVPVINTVDSIHVAMNGNQTSSLTVGSPIQFNTVLNGNNMTLSASYGVPLFAGKSYEFLGGVIRVGGTVKAIELAYRWFIKGGGIGGADIGYIGNDGCVGEFASDDFSAASCVSYASRQLITNGTAYLQIAKNYNCTSITSETSYSAWGKITQTGSTGIPMNQIGMTGVILEFGGSTAPDGWLMANGQAVSRTQYANLFNVIGTTYGVGDGSTTFNVPDKRYRTGIGAGSLTWKAVFDCSAINVSTNAISIPVNNTLQTGNQVIVSSTGTVPGGLTAGINYFVIKVSNTTFSLATSLANAVAGTAIDITSQGTGTITLSLFGPMCNLGDVGGEDTHATTVSEMPAHNHNIHYRATDTGSLAGAGHPYTIYNGSNSSQWYTNSDGGGGGIYADPTGNSASHNNMQPWIAMNYIIKY